MKQFTCSSFFASGVARFAPVVLLLPILAVRMMYPVTWRGTVPFYFLVVCGALFLVAVRPWFRQKVVCNGDLGM